MHLQLPGTYLPRGSCRKSRSVGPVVDASDGKIDTADIEREYNYTVSVHAPHDAFDHVAPCSYLLIYASGF
jgi:hypothetical protein